MSITDPAPLDQVCSGAPSKAQYPVLAETKIVMGQFVFIDGDGFAGDPASSLMAAGVAEATADNGATGTNSGDMSVNVLEGLFWRPVDGSNPPVQADVGEKVFAKDNYTVSNNSSDGPILGVLYAVDDELGALVYIGLAQSRGLVDAT